MAQTIGSDDLGQDKTNQAGNQNQQAMPGSNPQGNTSNPSQSGQGGGSNAPTVSSYNPNQQKGSGYTNIQRIVQANQGNQLGQAVGSGIQQAGSALKSNLGNAQNQFQQQTAQNQANTAGNQQVVQNVLGSAENYIPTGNNDQNAQQGAKFQQLISGQYLGPNQLQNAQQLQGQAANVNQMGQALGTSGGRAGLLQQFVGNPQYSRGQQTLDTLLLGQQNNSQALANARQSTAGLGNQVQGAIQGAQAQGQEQSGLAKSFGQNVQNQFGQRVSDINTGLQNQATTAQTQRDAQYQQQLKDLQSGNITQQEADQLGLTNGQQVTGDILQNAGNFVTQNADKASAQNVASTQDYSRLNALRQLAGQSAPQTAQDTLGQYSGQDQLAGKFAGEQAFAQDQSGFTNALQGQMANYNAQINPALQGQQNAQKIADLVKQRDAANTLGGLGGQIQANNIQNQIAALAPGAVNNGTTRTDWANSNLANAQTAYQNALNSANSAVGGIKNITITPQQQAQQDALNQMAGNNG